MSLKDKILIVEDEFILANGLRLMLREAGFEVEIASSVPKARIIIEKENPTLVILDIHLEGSLSGIDLAKELKAAGIGFIYLSANSTQNVLDAAKITEPYGFLIKPYRKKDLLIAIEIAQYHQRQKRELLENSRPLTNVHKEKATISHPAFENIIGKSQVILKIFDQVSRVAPMDTSVLISGESGTGKEKLAHSIHLLSPRRYKPFIIINCAALPPNLIESELFGHEKGAFTGAMAQRIGKFEQADGGSIFLDEIGELPIDMQAKLLRALQEKQIERVGGNKGINVNVRVIAATNRDLEKEVADSRFRIDLYYRLNVFPIIIPPLRERTEDIPLLLSYFLEEFSRRSGQEMKTTGDAVKELMHYSWPGNIRELQHVVERSALMASDNIIHQFLLPRQPNSADNLGIVSSPQSLEDAERIHIINALKKSNNKIYGPGGAAELLKIPPTTLNSKMKKLGIDKTLYHPSR